MMLTSMLKNRCTPISSVSSMPQPELEEKITCACSQMDSTASLPMLSLAKSFWHHMEGPIGRLFGVTEWILGKRSLPSTESPSASPMVEVELRDYKSVPIDITDWFTIPDYSRPASLVCEK